MEFVKRNKKISSVKAKEEIFGTLFASIPVVGFLLFGLTPMVLAIVMSFFKITGYSFAGADWVGLGNFREVLFGKQTQFWLALKNTFYAALGMPLSIILSMLVSVVLFNNKWGTKTFRVIFFIPFTCSVVAVTAMWGWMFDYNYGILNSVVTTLGMERVGWLTEAKMFMPSMIMMGLWGGMGYGIILFSAALTNVPKSLHEAARIDGAGSVRSFFSVTLPCISPTIFFLLSIGLVNSLQDFARFQIMASSGGPNNAGLTAVFYLWRMGFQNVFSEGMGKASATSIILALIIITLVTLNFKLGKKWVHHD